MFAPPGFSRESLALPDPPFRQGRGETALSRPSSKQARNEHAREGCALPDPPPLSNSP